NDSAKSAHCGSAHPHWFAVPVPPHSSSPSQVPQVKVRPHTTISPQRTAHTTSAGGRTHPASSLGTPPSTGLEATTTGYVHVAATFRGSLDFGTPNPTMLGNAGSSYSLAIAKLSSSTLSHVWSRQLGSDVV